MTVKNVGGALIDLTRREAQNDQLSCFYPHGMAYSLEGPVEWPKELPSTGEASRIAFRAKPIDGTRAAQSGNLQIIVGYELADGARFLTVRSLIHNPTQQPVNIDLADDVRADGEFTAGLDSRLNLWWCFDEFWGQAYAVQPAEEKFVVHAEKPEGKGLTRLQYRRSGGEAFVIDPNTALVLERRVFVAADTLGTQSLAPTARRTTRDRQNSGR